MTTDAAPQPPSTAADEASTVTQIIAAIAWLTRSRRVKVPRQNKRHRKATIAIGEGTILLVPCGAAVVDAGNVTLIVVLAPADPGVTVGELKTAVAPDGSPETDIATALSYAPPCGITVIFIFAVLPEVALTGLSGPVNEYVGACVPDPDKLTVSGLPAALSVIVTAPTRDPTAVGVKLTLMLHCAPAATFDPQLSDSWKSPLFAPVTAMLPIVRPTDPGTDRVTDCAALVVPTVCGEKERLGADRLTFGTVWIPMPVKATLCGLLGSLSTTMSAAA